MSLKTIISFQLVLLICISIKAQTFKDGPSSEPDGNFPSKWELISGSSEIRTFEGEKVIYLSHRGIITPALNSKDYLSEDFTLTFDAYFDKVEGTVYYNQYYEIRFWEGNSNIIVPSSTGNGYYDPIKVFRNGATLIGREGSTEKINNQVYDKSLESKEGLWRTVVIKYNKGSLKISIDGIQLINIAVFNYRPKMVSIGSHYNLPVTGFTRGLKNVELSGITAQGYNTAISDNNDSLTVDDSKTINTVSDNNANQDSDTALIYGDFESDILRVNGQFQIGNPPNGGYAFPKIDGKPKQVLQSNGNGQLVWADSSIPPSMTSVGYENPLPENDGAPGQILQTNGDGTVSWVDLPNYSPSTVNEPSNNETPTSQITGQCSGLEAIDEGNGIGWRLIGRKKYPGYAIGKNAIDLSYTIGDGDGMGALGDSSFCFGNSAYSLGDNSVAMGILSLALGNSSVALGNTVTAKGIGSIALGMESQAGHDHSTAIGFKVTATGLNSIVMGTESTATGEYDIALGEGNISSGARSVAIGNINTASALYSIAIGNKSTSSAQGAAAIGHGSKASGIRSSAIGFNTLASGELSTALGIGTVASGENSTAFGISTVASGENSTSMGFITKSESFNNTAIGVYNIGGGNPTNWIEIDPLFEIGNGKSNEEKSNALTILKNGNMGITTNTPQVKLHITGGSDANLSAGGYLIIGNKQGENLVFDNNEIMARNNVQPSTLYLQHNGGDVQVGGTVVHSSDRRLKKDIKEITYGLNEIMQLRPKSYYWQDRDDKQKSLGLIAQEVQPIISELVQLGNDEDHYLSLNYSGLIPVLIKAIQEQQDIIEKQNQKIDQLSSELSEKDQSLNDLSARVKQIETLLKQEKQ